MTRNRTHRCIIIYDSDRHFVSAKANVTRPVNTTDLFVKSSSFDGSIFTVVVPVVAGPTIVIGPDTDTAVASVIVAHYLEQSMSLPP